jgi:hypothetical protein
VLTTIAAIAGLVFGLSGLIVSILNYRRDRPKVRVSLQWDSVVVHDKFGRQVMLGQICITNTGRSTVYIESAGIELWSPTSLDCIHRKKQQGEVRGRRIAEGDPPYYLFVPDTEEVYDALIEYAVYWKHIRAFAYDSAGKKYMSPKMWLPSKWGGEMFRPSWGVGHGDVSPADIDMTWIVECDMETHQLEALLLSGEWVVSRHSENVPRGDGRKMAPGAVKETSHT